MKQKALNYLFRNVYFYVGFFSALVWILLQRKINIEAWNLPITYNWDDWQTLAQIKTFWTEFLPYGSKIITHLGAPYSAQWNDWPFGDDFLFAIVGLVSLLTNEFVALNIAALMAHIFCGLSMAWSLRRLGVSNVLTFVGGVSYALCPYLFRRETQHIVLTYAWHLPLIIYFGHQLFSKRNLEKKDFTLGVFVAISSGLFYVYYCYVFLQVAFFGMCLFIFNKQIQNAMKMAMLILTAILTTILGQLDTFIFQFQNGPNTQAMVREVFELEYYALKLPELVFPTQHRVAAFSYISDRLYHSRYLALRGEEGYAYLGLVGLVCLALFAWNFYRKLFTRKSEIHFLEGFLIWIIFLSFAGGLNTLISIFSGFYGFRCTNRYSSVVLVIILFLGLQSLSKLKPTVQRILAVFLVGFVILDLPPRIDWEATTKMSQKIESDRNFGRQLEQNLPDRAMIFQLPVQDYAGSPAIHQMADYESFRPYFFTKDIHFSYGSTKGRAREAWQHEVEGLPVSEMVSQLESIGFSGISITRKGFVDQKLEHSLQQIGYFPSIESSDKEIVFYPLKPSLNPVLPSHKPYFESGWGLDFDGQGNKVHWTENGGVIVFDNSSEPLCNVTLSLTSYFDQKLSIVKNGALNSTVDVKVGPQRVSLEKLDLTNGLRLAIFPKRKPYQSTSGKYQSFSISKIDLNCLQ